MLRDNFSGKRFRSWTKQKVRVARLQNRIAPSSFIPKQNVIQKARDVPRNVQTFLSPVQLSKSLSLALQSQFQTLTRNLFTMRYCNPCHANRKQPQQPNHILNPHITKFPHHKSRATPPNAFVFGLRLCSKMKRSTTCVFERRAQRRGCDLGICVMISISRDFRGFPRGQGLRSGPLRSKTLRSAFALLSPLSPRLRAAISEVHVACFSG